MGIDKLGMIVVKRYGTGTEDGEFAEVVSYCDAPSFHLRSPDGSEYHWREDLTRPASANEVVQYWQQRAATYERLANKTQECLIKAMDQNQELIERLNNRATE